MATSKYRRCCLLLLVMVVSGAWSCPIPNFFLPPPGVTLSVPYHPQIDPDYCVPAVLTMWKDYQDVPGSYPDSYEDSIWNYGVSMGWASHVYTGSGNGGFLPAYLGNIATYVLGTSMTKYDYPIADARKAISDQAKNIDNGNPVMVQANYGVHAVLLVGTSWHELSGSARPQMDYVQIHDPAQYHSPYESYTVQIWMSSKGTACSGACISNIMLTAPYFSAAEYQVFEQAAGTFYGDAAPPVLSVGERLYPNQGVTSADGRFTLVYQSDGNLVLYGPSGPIWATNNFHTPGHAEMQGDGNFVVYDQSLIPQWASSTSGSGATYLGIHNNGNMSLDIEPYSLVWQTNTGWY